MNQSHQIIRALSEGSFDPSDKDYEELRAEAHRTAERTPAWDRLDQEFDRRMRDDPDRENDHAEWLYDEQEKIKQPFLDQEVADFVKERKAEFDIEYRADQQREQDQREMGRFAMSLGLEIVNVSGGSFSSRYSLFSRRDTELFKLRISDHPPPVGRGGFWQNDAGETGEHSESDYSISPQGLYVGGGTVEGAKQALQKWASESGEPE